MSNEDLLNLLITLTITVIVCLFTYSAYSREKYPGEFDNVPQATKDFYKSLKQPTNSLSCCDYSDCEETDYETKGNHYRAYLSEFDIWQDVPEEAVITDPEVIKGNTTGRPIVCYDHYRGNDPAKIYCFLPGAGT